MILPDGTEAEIQQVLPAPGFPHTTVRVVSRRWTITLEKMMPSDALARSPLSRDELKDFIKEAWNVMEIAPLTLMPSRRIVTESGST